ncbi:hypothetical protein J2789_004908 [Variovorax paradoxus]|uniref:hypothetical protein n=1 Tax=Variovorax atrisoli TaxID=3394203 RepID=UPI00119A7404|nr:hypothetical protein [Variovorax paradoxus]
MKIDFLLRQDGMFAPALVLIAGCGGAESETGQQAQSYLRRSAFRNAVALYKALGGGLMDADAKPCVRAPRGASGWQPARFSVGADSHVLSQSSG